MRLAAPCNSVSRRRRRRRRRRHRRSCPFTCVARAAAARISPIRFHVYFITQLSKLRRDGDRSEGDAIIGEILSEGHVLIPFAVDGYGGLGPMARRFLFGDRPRRALTFRQDRPNATRMYARASNPPAPHAVVTLASIRWKQNHTRAFYGEG
ncbi:hypothetical protein THAOC_21669 [Thalassiosira oceanica]|uniref:Uncharacterized protein n=1 Tax=Thalassiosira oceanica TaxID=159749 RepID=K0S0N5_THAOC|nr:hypothetical protein THAOC_21669 [Thalassiosira oceanica]|eukprot:EJK58224.1 hypothetical protein THAOC_21669 [Thalassiosira oceanica]